MSKMLLHTRVMTIPPGASLFAPMDLLPTQGGFGAAPETIAAVDGPEASRLIPKIRNVVENYKFRAYGDYNAWPGPNSKTLVEAVLEANRDLRSGLSCRRPPLERTTPIEVNGSG